MISNCKICGVECKKECLHAVKAHKITEQDYYDTYYKTYGEDICAVCGEKSTFRSMSDGYPNTCSPQCRGEYFHRYLELQHIQTKKSKKTKMERYGDENYVNSEKIKDTCLKKYGVDNASKSPIVINKLKETNNRRFGGNSSMSSKITQQKSRNTNLKNYGVEYASQATEVKKKTKDTVNQRYGGFTLESPELSEKVRQTNLVKYGNEQYCSSETGLKKFKSACLEKYGVEHPMQSEIYRHQVNAGIYKHIKYKTIFGDVVIYQSAPELEFIQSCEHKNIRILNGPKIRYSFNNKIKIYYADFIIFDTNGSRIIEVKRTHKWWFQELASGKIKAKTKAAIKYSKDNGYLPYKILFK